MKWSLLQQAQQPYFDRLHLRHQSRNGLDAISPDRRHHSICTGTHRPGGYHFTGKKSCTRLYPQDEYHLFINLAAIGSGLPIFKEINQYLHLNLETCQQFNCGIALLKYTPKNKWRHAQRCIPGNCWPNEKSNNSPSGFSDNAPQSLEHFDSS